MAKNDSDPPARELGDGSANLLFDHARRGARWAVPCIVRQTFCIAYTTASSLYLSHARLGDGFEFVQLEVMPQWHTVWSVRLLSLWSGWENQAAMLTSDADDDGT